MNKTLLFTLLALLGMTQMAAQEYEYVPLVREGVKWVYFYDTSDEFHSDPNLAVGKVYLTLELKGDTVINGKSYKAMHKYYGDAINTENDTIPIYLREEDKVVYGIIPDGKTYHDCPITRFGYLRNRGNQEFILYDFNDPVAFCQTYSDIYQYDQEFYEEHSYKPAKPFKFADTVTINGHKVKRYVFSLLGECCFIESIGFDSLLHGYLLAFGYDHLMCAPIFGLSHVIEDGKVIYQSAKEIDNQPYLPITRTNVKWVSEQVSIHDEDTTSYYYTYEFEPIENNRFDYNCYYSSYDEINPCTDSIISLGRDLGHVFSCIQNKKLEPYLNNGENLIDFFCTNGMHKIYELYRFDEADISSSCLLNYYIDYEKYDLLNRENFVQVEPLTIEGVTCSRYAYISDQSDTLCYVVEGIGFDSYDMGDLLTPFTRRPDPTADYQEYCGLSHVVKDGQIIYKGMRYREGVQTGINEVVTDQPRRVVDDYYYNLMGQPVGKEVPSTPGIYIHQGRKIVVR